MLTKVFSVVCVLVVLSSALAFAEKNVVLQIEDTDSINANGTTRGKRTIGVVLRNVADLFGYDVQKRPTVIPPSMAPAPAPAPAAAPAPAPAAPAPSPGMMMGGDIMMAPVAMVNRQMPARVPLLPPAPPLPVLPPPVTFPPILQEQVRKTFNINFNWNKAVGSAQPVAQPNKPAQAQPPKPAQPAAPAPPQPASLPEGPITSGPKRPVTKAQLYSSYEYLYPPLGSAPPSPKYMKKKYNYKYGPIKTVTNYNDEPEPSHEQLSNEKESSAEDNDDDYNTFVAHEDGTPEEGKKEQYKNNVRNFWKNNHWALQDNGYKYIAPEAQQQQNFQQDYPKEILTVKESNYYKPLQPLKKVKFQDYYVTQAVQPKQQPAQPLPTQDISQFKKYYVQSSVPKLDLPAQQSPESGITTQDGKQISQQDLKNIVQQLVHLTQQAKQQQQNTPSPTQSTPQQPEVLSKYEEYGIPSSKDYSIPTSKDYSPSSKEFGIPSSKEYGASKEYAIPSSIEYGSPASNEEYSENEPSSKEEQPTSTERVYVNPKNPRQKKLEKEKALVKKKEFNNAYKEEKREPTVVEHDYNILNTVTGNEIPYDERKFEEFKSKHGYVAPEDAELPKPESGEEVKEEEKKEEGGSKEPLDDDYVANIRKPQGKPTEEHIETTGGGKGKLVNVKEPIYDSYNDYEEQNDAPALPPQLEIAEEEEYEDEDDGEEEKQNVAEEDEDDEEEEEEQAEAPQRAHFFRQDFDYPAANKQKEEEEESRINEKIKKIISVEAQPVETEIVPTPTYQYFTFRNRRILGFDDPEDSASNQRAAQTTASPDYEDFSYKPGTTLLRAEIEKEVRDKLREEGEVDREEEERESKFKRYKPSPFVTEKVPDFDEVKKFIKKSTRKGERPKKRSRRREEKKRNRERTQEVAATTPEQLYTEASVFTYAPTDAYVERTERNAEETQEFRTQRSRDREESSKKKNKKEPKYVELSEFLERYDDFDYLRELDRLKAAAADSSEEKDEKKEKENEKPAEEAESKRKEHLSSIWDGLEEEPQKTLVREPRSKNSRKQKEEDDEDEDEAEETTTEVGKFFDNYQIFKDFFNTKTDSHEDDEEEESEEETKKEKSSTLGYPGFAKAYEEFDYTRKPDFSSLTTTEAPPKQKKEDNKEKKESSSENHNRYDYFNQPFEQQEKPEADSEKEPQEENEKQKVDNPYSIPTTFDISHYTNPEIPEIPDFILEEERREAELAKQKLLNPGVRRVKKPRKHPGSLKPVIPAAKIIPVNVANTNLNPNTVRMPNPAYKPVVDNSRNDGADTKKVETLYSGLQPNQLHELSKGDKTLPLTIPFDYDYSGTEVVQRAVAARRRRRRRDVPSKKEIDAFTYLPSNYDRDFSYTIPEPAAQTNYAQYEKKDHPDDEPLSQKAKVVTMEVGKLKGHIQTDEDVAAF